jgi:hypothetical protein
MRARRVDDFFRDVEYLAWTFTRILDIWGAHNGSRWCPGPLNATNLGANLLWFRSGLSLYGASVASIRPLQSSTYQATLEYR